MPTLVVTLPLVWNVFLKPGSPVLTDIPVVPKFSFTPGNSETLFLNLSPIYTSPITMLISSFDPASRAAEIIASQAKTVMPFSAIISSMRSIEI